jgi:hypothetical protein
VLLYKFWQTSIHLEKTPGSTPERHQGLNMLIGSQAGPALLDFYKPVSVGKWIDKDQEKKAVMSSGKWMFFLTGTFRKIKSSLP